MADNFLGEIRIFSGSYAPVGWALCNGQLLSIQQNTALFSLLGVQFGGDGKSTFGLPNFQGAGPMCFGNGLGLTPRVIGESFGAATVTLAPTQLASHNHGAAADVTGGTATTPVGNVWSEEKKSKGTVARYSDVAANPVAMDANALSSVGGFQPHNNLAPYLPLTFIIATNGIYPSRS